MVPYSTGVPYPTVTRFQDQKLRFTGSKWPENYRNVPKKKPLYGKILPFYGKILRLRANVRFTGHSVHNGFNYVSTQTLNYQVRIVLKPYTTVSAGEYGEIP